MDMPRSPLLGSGLYRAIERAALAGGHRELADQLTRARGATASFLVHMLLGFSAYAFVMKFVSDQRWTLTNATVLTGPLMVGMAALAISWARRSGFRREALGVTLRNAGRDALEAALWTAPVLVGLTLAKWGALTTLGRDDLAVIPLLRDPWVAGPWIAALIYALLVPVQEFLARGVIQSALFALLTGTRRRRHVMAVLVANSLFAVTHLHLTISYSAAAFVGGLLWGALYARQGSLVGPVVSHALLGVYALTVLDLARVFKGIT